MFLGYYTGSVYSDKSLLSGGFLGESTENGSVIAIKTHSYTRATDCDKLIVLIRNPYQTLIAEMNRRMSTSHVQRGNENIFKLKGELSTFQLLLL